MNFMELYSYIRNILVYNKKKTFIRSINEKLNFNTPRNIEILRASDIVPKITKKKRMEIYTFNTK